jgi:hypothetical protein
VRATPWPDLAAVAVAAVVHAAAAATTDTRFGPRPRLRPPAPAGSYAAGQQARPSSLLVSLPCGKSHPESQSVPRSISARRDAQIEHRESALSIDFVALGQDRPVPEDQPPRSRRPRRPSTRALALSQLRMSLPLPAPFAPTKQTPLLPLRRQRVERPSVSAKARILRATSDPATPQRLVSGGQGTRLANYTTLPPRRQEVTLVIRTRRSPGI